MFPRIQAALRPGKRPWHEDDNPSFSVNLENGAYVCHRCGREGSVYTFLIDELGYSKKQAYDEIHGTSPEP